MDSKIYSDMAEAYKQVYAPKEDTIVEELIIELCDEFDAFETLEERAEFAVDVVESGTTLEFLSLLAEELEVDITEFISESAETLEESKASVRSIINALSRKGRSKALKTTLTTALGTKGNIVHGAPVAPTVRSARKLRDTTAAVTRTPGGPLAAAQTRKAADVSAATRQIPGANQTSAGSLKAVTDRGVTRHNQAMNQFVKNQQDFFKAFQKTLRQSAAETKLTKAAQGTTGSTVRIGQPGATKPVQSTTTGGLIGTRNISKPGAGLPRQAPKPAWGSGSGMGPKQSYPKAPRNPGGDLVKTNARRTAAQEKAARAAAGTRGTGTTNVAPTPTSVVRANARRTAAQEKAARAAAGTRGTGTTNAYPGPEARNMTVDVTATSRRTTGQLVKDFIGKHRGKLATGAVATTALGLTSSSGKRTADTSPTTPPEQNLASVEPPKAPEKPKTPETKTPETKAPETKTPETKAPEKPKTPETKTPETKTPETPKSQQTTKSARQIELDKINADKTLSDNEKWEKANRRLARVAAMRKAGASREEINKVLYNKGTKAYGAK